MRVRIGLRTVLLLALLPVLLLPWVGLRFVGQMAELTQAERRESLEAATRGFAATLHERADLFGPSREDAPLANGAVPLPLEVLTQAQPDGKADEWAGTNRQAVPVVRFEDTPEGTLRVRMAVGRMPAEPGRRLLLVEADDERYVRSNPSPFDSPESLSELIEVTRAGERWSEPGFAGQGGDLLIVEAGPTVEAMGIVPAAIVETRTGWLSEVALPHGSRLLRLRVRDVDYQASRKVEAYADSGLVAIAGPDGVGDGLAQLRAAEAAARWQQALAGTDRAGMRVMVVDASGIELARRGELDPRIQAPSGVVSAMGRWLLGWAVRLGADLDDQNSAISPLGRALNGVPDARAVRVDFGAGEPWWVVTAAQPVWLDDRVAGALVLEQGASGDLRSGQAALESLALFAAFAIVATVVALLAIATVTVARIRRLRAAAEAAIDPRGRVIGSIPRFRMQDEIGSLAQGYERVLNRLREHQHYLANLRSRLVHELRTPIMVVRSSLENLAEAQDDDAPDWDDALPEGSASSAIATRAQRNADAAFVQRALGGAMRLEKMVASMSEAASLESMLADSQLEEVDLNALLSHLVQAYEQAWSTSRASASATPRPALRFALESHAHPAIAMVVPETIAQAIDKLAANAADFAEPGSTITLTLARVAIPRGGARQAEGYEIAMINRGRPLPDVMSESLFESMVSVRGGGAREQSHLGLGLYLVRLIAEFHGGRAFAANVEGGVRIGFTVADSLAPEAIG